jgi:cytochrome c oxidase subunit IV
VSSASTNESTRDDHEETAKKRHHERRMYLRFGAMIATSTVVMFLLTYTNVFVADHIRWSEERVYMALLMGSAMAIIMLGYMWGLMYRNVRVNVAIVIGALALGTAALLLSRTQVLVGDPNYMRGMIPHHSIAILTSERAQIEDVRVRELADEIIEAQRREIAEMTWLVEDIEENGVVQTQEEAEERPVPTFEASP